MINNHPIEQVHHYIYLGYIIDDQLNGKHTALDNPHIICRAYSGATLSSNLLRTKELVFKYKPRTCLILVGVNDLTVRDQSTRWVRVAMYEPFLLANMVIGRILKLCNGLLQPFPETKVIFGGINGINIARYNNEPTKSNEQWVIDDAITQINAYIRLLNRVGGN